MTKLLTLLIACLALTLPLAACGSDDDSGDDGGGGSSATSTEQTGGGGGSKATSQEPVSVEMKDIKFVPHDATVKAGGLVQWTNNDQVPHTVTWTTGPGEKFDSGNVAPGDVYEVEFKKPGKVEYVCEIHPGQDGTVTVK